jgi:hypothetical protein
LFAWVPAFFRSPVSSSSCTTPKKTTGAKTSTASICTQCLPLIASRDEVMELAAKISQLVHPQCYSISLFNRVKASPITLQAMGNESGAAILKSQTTEILRFVKGPPTLELGQLDQSWAVRIRLTSSVQVNPGDPEPLIERRFLVWRDLNFSPPPAGE